MFLNLILLAIAVPMVGSLYCQAKIKAQKYIEYKQKDQTA